MLMFFKFIFHCFSSIFPLCMIPKGVMVNTYHQKYISILTFSCPHAFSGLLGMCLGPPN